MNGVINLFKPPGITSAGVVSFVKRRLKLKVGHAGTLDPEAAGVLPLLIGRATRLFNYIADLNKVYLAEIVFGTATDTQDAQGQVISVSENIPCIDELKKALPDFTGEIQQIPSIYSALKKDGKRLYDLARAGQSVERKPRQVVIDSIDIVSQSSENSFFIRISCGKGTYIRTLCHDLGEFLGSAAHMNILIRKSVGYMHMDEACTMQEIENESFKLLPADSLLCHIPKLVFPQIYSKKLLNGVAIPLAEIDKTIKTGGNYRVYIDDEFIGIGYVDGNMLRSRLVYAMIS